MKRHSSGFFQTHISGFAALLMLSAISPFSSAASLNLATVPLANSTTTLVLPNLMYIQDNSGSMNWDYVPDWVVDGNYCKSTGTGTAYKCCRTSSGNSIGSSTVDSVCMPNPDYSTIRGMPPFLAADFNRIYYNPAITYALPVNYDGTNKSVSYGTDYGAVPYDGYGKQSTAKINLKSDFPDVEWCTDNSYTDCVRNDNYLLPGTIGGKSYTTMHATTSTIGNTAYFSTGTVSSPTKESRSTGPFYYVIIPGEYCTAVDLKTCQAATQPSAAYPYPAHVRWCTTTALTTCKAVQDSTYKYPKYPTIKTSATATIPGAFKRVDIFPGQTYGNIVADGYTVVDRSNRTDCLAKSNCTYAEEMANFANWLAWYRTRLQMMKTTVSQSFKTIGNKYRIGLITINSSSSNYLAISKFNSTQKNSWYDKLFNVIPSGGTPLRSTLAEVGRIFAGQNRINSTDEDPIEYSCQQNFALLTTDGYWNTDSTATTNNPDVTGLYQKGSNSTTTTSSQVGNQDASPVDRPMYEGATASYNSLADVAKYYYDKDLRDPTLAGYKSTTIDNCTVTGADDDNPTVTYTRNVCENNVFVSSTDNNIKQHMTTFTLGLGVDGRLQYTNDYATATSGDYYCLKTGTCTPTVDWPVPAAESATAVDDLWHAAVNGQGKYFSAKDPAQLSSGLNSALASISSKVGAGAAAATSTLNPVSGDNYAYVASYTTAKWTGNLEKRSIDTSTGEVSESAVWCVENVSASSCTSPSSLSTETVNNSSVTYCVTPSVTVCPGGILDGTNCKVEVPLSCTGTMAAKVSGASDTRSIYTKGSGGLVAFDSAFATANPSYFDATKLSNLSQWAALTASQKSAAVGGNLLNFLRGQKGLEDTTANTVDNRIYRYREAVLGDLIESQPAYIGKPTFSYLDAGYSQFVTAQTSRAGTIYVGANDGMLHAFNASNGNERWAYIPTPVLPNLWKLADKSYLNIHTNYVNGSPIISDICAANCTDAATAVWKTILVGGLNSGGRGYYAIDITDPVTPILLWEFTNSNDQDLGYTYGTPVVTKKSDGTWVVLLTSGYNNSGTVPGDGDGKGYLYVLNANTGVLISKIGTGVGTTTTPSGLAKITAWADNTEKNNTAGYVYGGDLLGNVWRFDINAGSAFKFAILKDSAGLAQPITVKPELGLISSMRVVFVGTGKYLETTDLANTQRQSIYGIKDDGSTTTLDNPRLATGANTFVAQTMTSSGSTRSITSNVVDWTVKRGWYVDLDPAKANEGSERVNIGMQLVSGTLLVASVVPANSECSPGGYGWFNYFNYKTGGGVDASGIVSDLVTAPIVGFNVIYIAGKPKVGIITANNPTPEPPPNPPKFGFSASGFQGKRVIWRELVQ